MWKSSKLSEACNVADIQFDGTNHTAISEDLQKKSKVLGKLHYALEEKLKTASYPDKLQILTPVADSGSHKFSAKKDSVSVGKKQYKQKHLVHANLMKYTQLFKTNILVLNLASQDVCRLQGNSAQELYLLKKYKFGHILPNLEILTSCYGSTFGYL